MKKTIALLAILVVSLLVIGGCSLDNEDVPQPPTLPSEEVTDNQNNLEENNLQPPALPEE